MPSQPSQLSRRSFLRRSLLGTAALALPLDLGLDLLSPIDSSRSTLSESATTFTMDGTAKVHGVVLLSNQGEPLATHVFNHAKELSAGDTLQVDYEIFPARPTDSYVSIY